MLQRNTSELVAGLDERAASWPKAVVRSANALKDCVFCPFRACSSSILMADPLESALRNCNAALQIVACKCYLAAALGTLGDEAERQQKPDFWQPAAAIFAGIAQIESTT